MEAVLKELIESPQLHLYVDQLLDIMKKEEKARKEFYNKISEKDKAEFINGEAVFHSPVKFWHNNAASNLITLANAYINEYDLGVTGYDKIMIVLTRNSYEPDIVFFKKEKSKNFKGDQMFFPIPDFIVEVLSPTTEKNDRELKFHDYEAHGVEEYWIIDAEKETVEQYFLKNKKYQLIIKSKTGTITSKAISGFKIPIESIFNKKQNAMTLKQLVSAFEKKKK